MFRRKPDPTFLNAAQTTPHIDFLELSSRPEVQPIRDTLEAWFSEYPDSEKIRLARDFRSKRNREHLSAFFELYCHALAKATGYKVAPHPRETSGRAKDFHCVSADLEFDLEATVATDADTADKQSNNRSQLHDYLNKNAFVLGMRYGVRFVRDSSTTPPLSALAKRIKAWAAAFDRASLRTVLESDRSAEMPAKVFRAGDWQVEVTLLPRPHDEVDPPAGSRAIGFGPLLGGFMDNDRSIRNTLKKKAEHYADRSSPYIIAVNTWFELGPIDDVDFLQALLGTEVLLATHKSSDMARKPDGIWYGPTGPCNRHVSGVLHVPTVMPWSIARTPPVLYLNQIANHRISTEVFPVKTVLWTPDRPETMLSTGRPIWDIFGLWPEWSFPPDAAST